MDIGNLEIQIANYLRDNLTPLGFDAVPLPETESEFLKPFIRGKVTVAFTGEKPATVQSINYVSQHVTLTFTCSLQSRFLRGENGIHKLAELVKKILIGYEPTDCGRLYYTSHDFVKYDSGIWEHAVDFECKTLRVQEIFEPETAAPITDIKLDESFG